MSNSQGSPEDPQLLGYSEGKYQGLGLTEQDCLAIEKFNQLSRQQVEDRVKQAEYQQRQQRELEQMKAKSKGIEH
jgi:hypothetical protein